jgi:hypothetical protein
MYVELPVLGVKSVASTDWEIRNRLAPERAHHP